MLLSLILGGCSSKEASFNVRALGYTIAGTTPFILPNGQTILLLLYNLNPSLIKYLNIGAQIAENEVVPPYRSYLFDTNTANITFGATAYTEVNIPVIKRFVNSAHSRTLGMNNVPVLNQGQFGTCVTFSTTAIMDAMLGKGDYISQQCSLQLNLGLGVDAWNGLSFSDEVSDPLKQYGIGPKDVCGSYQSPPEPHTISQGIPIATYVANYATKDPAVVEFLAKLTTTRYTIPSNTLSLDAVRSAINRGNRVWFGSLLNIIDSVNGQFYGRIGFPVAISDQNGSNLQNLNFGLFACRQNGSINFCPVNASSNSQLAGHAMIITGYDDNQQLLEVRNSWGSVADNGNFYMTYTFFQAMVFVAAELSLQDAANIQIIKSNSPSALIVANPSLVLASKNRNGTPKTIYLKNTSSTITAKNITPKFTNPQNDVGIGFNNQCQGNIAPGQICSITLGSLPPGHTLNNSILKISGDNTNILGLNLSILDYGSEYQGGYVFALTPSVTDGCNLTTLANCSKIATKTDIAPTPWADPLTSVLVPGIDNYNGYSNTQKIITTLGASAKAALACANLSVNGFNNWYLPAICEMGPSTAPTPSGCTSGTPNMVNNLLFLTPPVGNFSTDLYWSSAEHIIGLFSYPWAQIFGSTPTQVYTYRENPHLLRCARVITAE